MFSPLFKEKEFIFLCLAPECHMDLSGLWKILLNVLDQQWEFIQREEAKKFQENIP